MFNIFLAVFFGTLGFAFLDPYFFIGYLTSSRCSGEQAIFMANAGGARDNAKKIVEVRTEEGHAAVSPDRRRRYAWRSLQGHLLRGAQSGHQVHDALRAAGRRVRGPAGMDYGFGLSHALSAVFLVGSAIFVYRSFYGMWIGSAA